VETVKTEPPPAKLPVDAGKQRLAAVQRHELHLDVHHQRALQRRRRAGQGVQFGALNVQLQIIHRARLGNVVQPARRHRAPLHHPAQLGQMVETPHQIQARLI
jgi:hypothetical protein